MCEDRNQAISVDRTAQHHCLLCRSRLHELFASSLDIVQIWNLKQECTAAMQGNVLGGRSQVAQLCAQSCLRIQ